MIITREMDASEFEEHSWCCEDFWKKIHEQNLEAKLDSYMEEIYPDGVDWVHLNDVLRFDGDMILECLGYVEHEEEEKDNGNE